MDLLHRAFKEALDRNDAEVIRWTQYKELHEAARRNLQEFQKSLEIEILVPIGTKALIPGRIYHTNEIVVSHSGTYYSKCSAHKAIEICQHRLEISAKRLDDLRNEADMYRNKLELPISNDAFSSNDAQEIIEPYDEEVEKRWRDEHKKKMKEHKQREAEEREKLLNTRAKDDVIENLDELELMEELENELEAMNTDGVDDDTIKAILNNNEHSSSSRVRISHSNGGHNQVQEIPSSYDASSLETVSLSSGSDDSENGDSDDDVPTESREIEHKAKAMSKQEKVKFFKTELAAVQEYLRDFRPKNMEDLSVKTDKMFLSDYLLSVIETLEDELNCDQYLNEGNVTKSETTTEPLSTLTPNTPQSKPILKKRGSKNDQQRRISFALEDDVKSFDRSEEPSKISSTIQFEHGPVLKIKINHSEKKFTETNKDYSDAIRSPADVYKHFAECKLIHKKEDEKPMGFTTVKESKKTEPAFQIEDQVPETKHALGVDADIIEAKAEVKEMLNSMFGAKHSNEPLPDPLPPGNFVDASAPKKRISLFKSSRMTKNK